MPPKEKSKRVIQFNVSVGSARMASLLANVHRVEVPTSSFRGFSVLRTFVAMAPVDVLHLQTSSSSKMFALECSTSTRLLAPILSRWDAPVIILLSEGANKLRWRQHPIPPPSRKRWILCSTMYRPSLWVGLRSPFSGHAYISTTFGSVRTFPPFLSLS